MEVKNFQKKIEEFLKAWDVKREVTPNEQETFNHIVEEIGEIAREYVSQNSRKAKFSAEELDNGIGDALIQLIKLANLRGLDVEELILNIIEDDQKLLKE